MSSLRDNSEQRIRNPLYGAFIFSWITFNWKAIAIFFLSERGIYLKIDDVQAVTNIDSLLYKPIEMTLIMVLVLPILNAALALFDVMVKVLHKYSDFYDSYINTIFTLRKERHSARFETEREMTIASQRKSIAKAEYETEQLKLEAALARKGYRDIEDLEEKINSQIEEINNLTIINEALKSDSSNKEQEISDLKEYQSGYSSLLDTIATERNQVEKANENIAALKSQNKALYIEASESRNRLRELNEKS